LGMAWIGFKGWAAREVWDSLHPALALATSLRRADALLPILFGLWANVLSVGRLPESLYWVAQISKAAKAHRDSDLLILKHQCAKTSYLLLGDLVKARKHTDKMLSLYREGQHSHLARIINDDPKTVALYFGAQATWMLGYPEQAVGMTHAAHDHARRVGHP